MIRKTLALIVSLLFLSITSHAGSRGLTALGMTNATEGEEPAISKRLFELLVSDAKIVYLQAPTLGFLWEPDVKITELPNTAGTFKALVTPTNKADVVKLIEKHEVYDGLIVYQYDKEGYVRLKLYDAKGNERILVRLPLEKDGEMKGSLLRLTRRSALVSVGGSIDFVP